MEKIKVFRAKRLAEVRLASSARRIAVLRSRLGDLFIADLQKLNDVLARTELHDHYWVWSGLLLGWAREGRVLAHDTLDADFAVLDEDFPRLIRAVPMLMESGFKCDRRFVNNSGDVTELTLMRHGARFEFFRMFPIADRLRYYMYADLKSGPIEVEASLPAQKTVTFRFLNRNWLKHEDHELELRSTYGEWKIPDPSWSYLDGPDIETRRAWLRPDFDWKYGTSNLMERVS